MFIRKHCERQYLDLVQNIIKNGTVEKTRNGVTRTLLGQSMRFDLTNNKMPLLTTKKMAWKTCLRELLWFVNGKTSNDILKEQNVKIWNDNASRDFLNSRNLFHLKEGDLGPVYGHQWRHFNAKYTDCDGDYTGQGVDQLQNVIDMLKDPKERKSRRIIMSAWNPLQLDEMALPPCHILCQFHVMGEDELSCSLYQRSGDVGLGIPFNIASYSFLTHLLAVHCQLKPKEFIHHIGNAHIYEDHARPLLKQTKNWPKPFPQLFVEPRRDNINSYSFDDFVLENYVSHPNIKMDMVV